MSNSRGSENVNPLCLFDGGYTTVGHLLDPSAAALLRNNRARGSSIANDAPVTLALAREMRASLPLRWEWLRPGRDGQWYTESANGSRRVGRSVNGKEMYRRGRSLADRDVALHLLGLTTAIGATDKPIGGNHDEARAHLSAANLVPALRIDVDMPFAWTLREGAEILREIRAEIELFRSLGLPARAFRTGGKGHQLAVALPSPTPHSVGSLLARAVRIHAERRRAKGVSVDVDNLSSHLRLAGGVHAKTRRVGLWIDESRGELHGAAEQARLMVGAYRYDQPGGRWTAESWENEVASLRLLLWGRYGWDFHRVLSAEEALSAIEGLASESALCDAIQRSLVRKGCRQPPRAAAATAVPESAADLRLNSSSPAARRRAREIWDDVPTEGRFYEWLRMDGGKQGILAAALLFGPELGREELVRRAREMDGDPSAVKQRISTIECFWPGFQGRHARERQRPTPLPDLPAATREAEEAVRFISEQMPRPKAARWRREDAYAVGLELLVAIETSETVSAAIGCRELAKRIARRSGSSPSFRRVADMVERLVEGTDTCVLPAFRRLERVATVACAQTVDDVGRQRGWVGEGLPSEYVVGTGLRLTPLGTELSNRRLRHLDGLYGDADE